MSFQIVFLILFFCLFVLYIVCPRASKSHLYIFRVFFSFFVCFVLSLLEWLFSASVQYRTYSGWLFDIERTRTNNKKILKSLLIGLVPNWIMLSIYLLNTKFFTCNRCLARDNNTIVPSRPTFFALFSEKNILRNCSSDKDFSR